MEHLELHIGLISATRRLCGFDSISMQKKVEIFMQDVFVAS